MRKINEIAKEISVLWEKPYFGAVPYLDAMHFLDDVSSTYGQESAKGIVSYFLANASFWRGDDAKRIKKELKAIIAPNKK